MPRFVILRHETPPGYHRPPHWDFMLEADGVLRTWALPEKPARGLALTVEAIADHRLSYLEYEGEVSGDRGRVARWDWGTYETVGKQIASGAASKIQAATRGNEASIPSQLHLIIHGEKMTGGVMLSPIRSHGDGPAHWRFLWKGS